MKRPPAPAAEGLDPERLFKPLAGARGLILAVSGGPDSTALMVLASRWRARPPILVVTVDHGLRPEAKAETELVARNAERLGLLARSMRAPKRDAPGNLQDWARRARYGCLAKAAREADCDTIVTAHHLDDQAETFLLRLARGSGVYGLAAMPEERTIEGLRLVRPLLGIPRERLAEIAAGSGLEIVADPSNADARFDRVRIRMLMPLLAQHGLSAFRLAGTAARLGRAAAALDHYARTLIAENFTADHFGVVRGGAAALERSPQEVALRALALVLQAAGGTEHTPRLDQLEPLLAAILNAPVDGRFQRTLGGVALGLCRGEVTARREWGRKGPESIPASTGSVLVWDSRFRIRVPQGAGLSIGPLGHAGRRLRAAGADQASVRTLPGVFAGDALTAVPERVAVADDGPPLASFAAECIVGSRLGMPASGGLPDA
jgi:tRNA(Ile)-lysidine synthase